MPQGVHIEHISFSKRKGDMFIKKNSFKNKINLKLFL